MSVLNEHFSLPVKEVVQKVVTATSADQVLLPGVYKGGIRVVGDDKLIPANIKTGVRIFGVDGSAVAGTPVTPTGPGPTSLIAGNLFAGYYGKATGIITGSSLNTLVNVKQVVIAIVTITGTNAGINVVTITAAGMTNSPKSINYTITAGITAIAVAAIMAAALAADVNVGAFFNVINNFGSSQVVLSAKVAAANDPTMNISISPGNGVNSAFTSVNATAGTNSITDDITWLKFASNNKTLFVADRSINTSISWHYIQAQDCVKGKVITINSKEYLCRLLTGSEHYWTGSLPTTNTSYAGGEWDQLIINFTPLDSDSHWTSVTTWCQEASGDGFGFGSGRVIRGSDSVSYFTNGTSSTGGTNDGWRPVLEVL